MQPPTDAQQEQTTRSFVCRGSPRAWSPLLGVAFCQDAKAKRKTGGVEHLMPPGYEGVSLLVARCFWTTAVCPFETATFTVGYSVKEQCTC